MALLSALVQQGSILLLLGMVLDGGALATPCLYGMAGFWGGVVTLRLRHRGTPTPFDLGFVRSGTVPVCALSFFVTYGIQYLRGW